MYQNVTVTYFVKLQRNFGTFSIRSREERLSRNPKTGTTVLVEAKKHPYFRASKDLKQSLNK